MTEFKGIDDEGTYVILGLAIRCAMDMDLSRPLPGLSERANRSRVRCWIALFNADRRYVSVSSLFSLLFLSSSPTHLERGRTLIVEVLQIWWVWTGVETGDHARGQRYSSLVRSPFFRACTLRHAPSNERETSLICVLFCRVTFHDHPLRTPGDARLISGTQVRRLISRYNDLIQTDGEAAQLNMREVYKGASGEIDGWADFWQGEITRMQGEDVDGIEVTRLHCKLMVRSSTSFLSSVHLSHSTRELMNENFVVYPPFGPADRPSLDLPSLSIPSLSLDP